MKSDGGVLDLADVPLGELVEQVVELTRDGATYRSDEASRSN
jgi:hypothetical protein